MKSWKIYPINETVSKFIECYWYLEKEASDETHATPNLYPDPCAHLIFSKNDQPYSYASHDDTFIGSGTHLIQPHLKSFTLDHADPFIVFGVKLKIGALYSLNIPDISNDINNIIDLMNFKYEQFNPLYHCENEIRDSKKQLVSKLDYIFSTLCTEVEIDRHQLLVQNVLPILYKSENVKVSEQLNCSQRTIERSFVKVTNMTLKQCHMLIRLERILDYILDLDEQEIDWPSIAQTFNFSDQPHLIRTLKS